MIIVPITVVLWCVVTTQHKKGREKADNDDTRVVYVFC